MIETTQSSQLHLKILVKNMPLIYQFSFLPLIWEDEELKLNLIKGIKNKEKTGLSYPEMFEIFQTKDIEKWKELPLMEAIIVYLAWVKKYDNPFPNFVWEKSISNTHISVITFLIETNVIKVLGDKSLQKMFTKNYLLKSIKFNPYIREQIEKNPELKNYIYSSQKKIMKNITIEKYDFIYYFSKLLDSSPVNLLINYDTPMKLSDEWKNKKIYIHDLSLYERFGSLDVINTIILYVIYNLSVSSLKTIVDKVLKVMEKSLTSIEYYLSILQFLYNKGIVNNISFFVQIPPCVLLKNININEVKKYYLREVLFINFMILNIEGWKEYLCHQDPYLDYKEKSYAIVKYFKELTISNKCNLFYIYFPPYHQIYQYSFVLFPSLIFIFQEIFNKDIDKITLRTPQNPFRFLLHLARKRYRIRELIEDINVFSPNIIEQYYNSLILDLFTTLIEKQQYYNASVIVDFVQEIARFYSDKQSSTNFYLYSIYIKTKSIANKKEIFIDKSSSLPNYKEIIVKYLLLLDFTIN